MSVNVWRIHTADCDDLSVARGSVATGRPCAALDVSSVEGQVYIRQRQASRCPGDDLNVTCRRRYNFVDAIVVCRLDADGRVGEVVRLFASRRNRERHARRLGGEVRRRQDADHIEGVSDR